jgi:hypothetical protein
MVKPINPVPVVTEMETEKEPIVQDTEKHGALE